MRTVAIAGVVAGVLLWGAGVAVWLAGGPEAAAILLGNAAVIVSVADAFTWQHIKHGEWLTAFEAGAATMHRAMSPGDGAARPVPLRDAISR